MDFMNELPPKASGADKLIQQAISEAIVKIANEEAAEAGRCVEKRVRAEAAQIAAQLLRRFDMSVSGNQLVIRVDFKNTEVKP